MKMLHSGKNEAWQAPIKAQIQQKGPCAHQWLRWRCELIPLEWLVLLVKWKMLFFQSLPLFICLLQTDLLHPKIQSLSTCYLLGCLSVRPYWAPLLYWWLSTLSASACSSYIGHHLDIMTQTGLTLTAGVWCSCTMLFKRFLYCWIPSLWYFYLFVAFLSVRQLWLTESFTTSDFFFVNM